MKFRRTSAPERIAGDILGFSTADEVEESQSVLAKYFPELSIRISPKGARGGRLGRAPQTAGQEIKYTPQEMLRGGGGAVTPANINTTTPAAQSPDYSSQIESIKTALINQSKILENLGKKKDDVTEKKPDEKPFVPQTAEEQARGQITKLYKDVLGREPEAEGLKSWMSEPRASYGITPEEYTSLEQDFKRSPEYNVLKLYREELGRTEDPRKADPEGFKYWTSQAPQSSDRLITPDEYGELQKAFRASTEYQQRQAKAASSALAGTTTSTGSAGSSAGTVTPPPTPPMARNFMPENPNPQNPEEAVKYLYQTQLGRTPSAQEAGYWLANPAFADKGLSAEEWGTLRSAFQASPEYALLGR